MQSVISDTPRQEVRAFWTGPSLSYYEQLSLKSIVASGARMLLYSPEKDLIVPEGVELVDANEILSGPIHQFRHANGDGSLALHSDLFRYLAIHKFGGWYIDLDVVLLGDKLPTSRIYIASDGPGTVNAAVMKFPEKSPIMATAIDEAWRLLPVAGMATSLTSYITIGPALMTRLVLEHALDHLVQPTSSAYEIPHIDILAFFDPARCDSVQERLANSDFTHLWNEAWRLCRIPKNYGPPEGSFLDGLFKRFDIQVPAHARLAYEAVEAWVREYRLLSELKFKLSVEKIRYDSLDHLARSIQLNGWQHGVRQFRDEDERQPAQQFVLAVEPQTIKTFWHGDAMGPYQLMCLRSFADLGHRIEVYSYNLDLDVPDWVVVKSAAEILPRERVLRPFGDDGRFAIHANLFRYALLHLLGGWWIDPDVLLLKPDLPSSDIFLGSLDMFGRVPTGALKFPAGHPLLAAAIAETDLLGDSLQDWEMAGSALLTSLVERREGRDAPSHTRQSLGPVSWYDVPDLFNPACADELNRKCNDFCFLQLHDEVWRRAGVPHNLAPPEGSFLDGLFVRHAINAHFPAKMAFGELNRWIAHMYQSVRQQGQGSSA